MYECECVACTQCTQTNNSWVCCFYKCKGNDFQIDTTTITICTEFLKWKMFLQNPRDLLDKVWGRGQGRCFRKKIDWIPLVHNHSILSCVHLFNTRYHLVFDIHFRKWRNKTKIQRRKKNKCKTRGSTNILVYQCPMLCMR